MYKYYRKSGFWPKNTNEFKNKQLQAKDNYGYITWHRVALSDRLVALETLWGWAKRAEL